MTRCPLLLGLAAAVTVAVIPASVALAQQKPQLGPTSQPKIGAACPTGYQSSGGYCVPGPSTKCRAFPKSGATCPVGYTTSFDYCVETGCQSR
jgi:hypothetical protein